MTALRRLLPLLFPLVGMCLGACSIADGDDTATGDDAYSAAPAWTTEREVQSDYAKVLKYNDDNLQRGSFRSDHDKTRQTRQGAGVDIAYAIARAPNEKGAIVLVNGRTESFSQYAELVYDLHRRGYSIYTYDHRGQGHSSRLLDYETVGDDDYEKGYVDNFQDYVDDFDKFMNTVVLPDRRGKAAPLLNLSHSLGGAVTTLYEEQHPGTFKALAMSSPMHGIQAGMATVLVGRAGNLVLPTSYAVGYGPLNLDAPYDNNKLTTSRSRFSAKHEVWKRLADTRVGGITYHWAIQSVDATKKVRAEASSVRTPLLILQAQYDQIVDLDAQNEVCEAVNAAGVVSCDLEPLAGARHETLIEVDAVRQHALDRIVAFFDAKSH